MLLRFLIRKVLAKFRFEIESVLYKNHVFLEKMLKFFVKLTKTY